MTPGDGHTDQDGTLTPAMQFSRLENSALLASVSAALQQLEAAQDAAGLARSSTWELLNSLHTLFAENGYAFERQHDAEPEVPFVSVGARERAPWADLPLTCPECGAGPLELQQSTGSQIVLSYIHHCGKSWLRGGLN